MFDCFHNICCDLIESFFLIGCSTNSLGFTPEFLGRVKLVTSIASLLGVGLYNGFLKNVALRKIFLVTTIVGSVLGMSQVCIIFQVSSYIFNFE